MKRWYVIQVFAGYEEIIKADILKRVEETGLQDLFGQILIPSAKSKRYFALSHEVQEDQQLFPGYMLIEMEAAPEATRLVLMTPRVSRFLGGTSPVPLTQKEIDRITAQMRGEVVVSSKKHLFEVGKEIEINEGPFAGFMGVVSEIDSANEKLKIMVSIFGRMTPVELGFDQVKQ